MAKHDFMVFVSERTGALDLSGSLSVTIDTNKLGPNVDRLVGEQAPECVMRFVHQHIVGRGSRVHVAGTLRDLEERLRRLRADYE